MHPIDLIYLDSIGVILERLAAEKQVAIDSGASTRVTELQGRIDELVARRERAARRMFGVVPAAAD